MFECCFTVFVHMISQGFCPSENHGHIVPDIVPDDPI